MASEHKMAAGKLSGENKEKHHEAHVRKLHSGYHVTKHHPDGSESEHSAADLDEAMQHIEDHMAPAEAEGDSPEGQEAQGSEAAAQPQPQQ